jgi:hypothetical protein
MPLTAKGEKILAAMKEQYGEEKGEEVFYRSKNKGTITGVDAMAEKPKEEEYWEGKESAFERNAKTKAARQKPKDSATRRILRIDVMPSGRVKVTRR